MYIKVDRQLIVSGNVTLWKRYFGSLLLAVPYLIEEGDYKFRI